MGVRYTYYQSQRSVMKGLSEASGLANGKMATLDERGYYFLPLIWKKLAPLSEALVQVKICSWNSRNLWISRTSRYI